MGAARSLENGVIPPTKEVASFENRYDADSIRG